MGGGDINAPYCVTGSNSYNVEFDHDNWLVVDTSSVAGEEISIDHYTMEEYTKMDAEAAGTAPVLSLDNCDTKPASGDLENHSELPPIASLSIYIYQFMHLGTLQQPESTTGIHNMALRRFFMLLLLNSHFQPYLQCMQYLYCLSWHAFIGFTLFWLSLHFDLIQWQASCSLDMAVAKTWPIFPAVNWYVSR